MRTALFFQATIITIFITSTAIASTNWRSYQRECGGNVKCMKAQAAAYQEFLYGKHNRDYRYRCKEKYVSSTSKNYIGALKCVKSLEKSAMERDRQRAQTEYLKKKTEVIEKERRYQKCRARGRSSNYCAKRYLD